MKEYETVKMYGKILNVWKHKITSTALNGKTYEDERTTQIELAYNEYGADGGLIRKGSEDFSMNRYNSGLRSYRVFTWDGKKLNAGGYRWFENVMDIVVNKGTRKNALEVVRHWFPDAAEIQLR